MRSSVLSLENSSLKKRSTALCRRCRTRAADAENRANLAREHVYRAIAETESLKERAAEAAEAARAAHVHTIEALNAAAARQHIMDDMTPDNARTALLLHDDVDGADLVARGRHKFF